MVDNRFIEFTHFIGSMAQLAETIIMCEACHHPKEAHAEWRDGRHSSPSRTLIVLRRHCMVKGCSCRDYVGLVWERPH